MLNRFYILSLCLLSAGIAHAQNSVCKANQPFILGAGLHLGQNKGNDTQAESRLAKLGLTSFRDELSWGRLEKEKGVLKIPENLAPLDGLLRRTLAAKDKSAVLALGYGNPFYDGGELPKSDEALAGYAKYAAFVAGAYAHDSLILELWNEWNSGMGSKIKPRQKGSPEDYLRLVQAAAPAIRQASPNSIILAGATAHIDPNWSNAFAKFGGLKLVDGFSVHPYNYSHPVRRTPEDAINGLRNIQKSMSAASGLPVVPFYITEMGVPTHIGNFGASEEQAAAYALRFLLMARTEKYICGVWWYELNDGGSDATINENRFGLIRQNGGMKAAAAAIGSVAKLIAEGHNFTQKRTDDAITVTWTGADNANYTAQWNTKGETVFDGAADRVDFVSPLDVADPSSAAKAFSSPTAENSTADKQDLRVGQFPIIYRRK